MTYIFSKGILKNYYASDQARDPEELKFCLMGTNELKFFSFITLFPDYY